MRILTDVLMSQAGYVGTHSRANLAHLEDAPELQPRLYVSGAELTSRYGRVVPMRGGLDWLGALEERWLRVTGRRLRYEVLCGLGCDKVTLGFADGVLDRVNREGNPGCCPFLGTVYAVGREIWFGAESDKEEVLLDREARRRSIRVDPKRSGQMWSAYKFEAQTRPHHVSGSLKEAVEYALLKEDRYCRERGVEPLFSGALRSVLQLIR
ncbi:hypothetical protein B0I37DRAFT_374530 [Chaetomium sp. MPI-CAGE-AT-0009]|nr:hypothetical protein B0I37DRAFT_374530 [Chaetomium sp. MPI-CAGE-AT-0009]